MTVRARSFAAVARPSRRDILAGGLGAAALALAPAQAHADVDADLRRGMAKWKVPGASYAILRGGRIRARAFGTLRTGGRAAVTPTTLFQACSLSKSVAAAAALVLVRRGSLALDADINASLRGWTLPPSPLADGHPVTLRRLLGMTGGINVPGFAGYAPGAPLPALRQILEGEPPANSQAVRVIAVPGTKEMYSGGGYQIAQAAIESAAGVPFARFAHDAVLKPAGMSTSRFEWPRSPVAAGHLLDGSIIPGGGNVFPELAAAGLWSTPGELARFLLVLFEGRRGALLTPELIEALLTPVDGFGYGLGGSIRGSGRERVFMKRGHNIGYHGYMMLFPATGQGAVLMTNAETGEHLIEPFLRGVAAREGWPAFGPLAD